MTFFANRNIDRPPAVDVHVTYGPITIRVEEDPGHLRHFWGELGRLLDAVEHDQREAIPKAGMEPVAVQPIGYQGPAQHTATATCDGFHEPGQCKAAPAEVRFT